jgi:RNA 3'-terminal phosphate cyclase (ATP)
LTHGWYPVGGGDLEVTITGDAVLMGIDLTERGALRELQGVGIASNLPSHIPQRISDRANNVLREADLPALVQPIRTGGPSTGAGIFLHMQYENVAAGFSALGERGKPSDKVADEAVSAAIAFHQQPMALDPHLPDQLLVALALAEGPSALSTSEITRHTMTNIAIINHFLDRSIQVSAGEGAPGKIFIHAERSSRLS